MFTQILKESLNFLRVMASMVAKSICPPSSAPRGRRFMVARPMLIKETRTKKSLKLISAVLKSSDAIKMGPATPLSDFSLKRYLMLSSDPATCSRMSSQPFFMALIMVTPGVFSYPSFVESPALIFAGARRSFGSSDAGVMLISCVSSPRLIEK